MQKLPQYNNKSVVNDIASNIRMPFHFLLPMMILESMRLFQLSPPVDNSWNDLYIASGKQTYGNDEVSRLNGGFGHFLPEIKLIDDGCIIQQQNQPQKLMNLQLQTLQEQPSTPINQKDPPQGVQTPSQCQKMIECTASSPIKKKSQNTRKPLYNWNKVENRKYVNFLLRHRKLFDLNNQERKCMKINVIMSDAIKTRSAAQCHSHHQKMMSKFNTIQDIVRSNAHLIIRKSVPKDMREFVDSILGGNQSSLPTQSSSSSILVEDESFDPLWLPSFQPFHSADCPSYFDFSSDF